MKTVVAALVTSLAIVSLGLPSPTLGQESMGGAPARAQRTAAISRRMTAEVLAVNRGVQALTVRSMTNGRATDAIFAVQDAVAPVLDYLEPGDVVLVTYVRVNDQLRAQRIEKAPERAQMQ